MFLCCTSQGIVTTVKLEGKGKAEIKEMEELPSFLASRSSSGISSGSLEISSLADALMASAWAASHALLCKEMRKHEW